MSRAKAWFLGAGPGAPDLLTIRAARAIADADVVIWGRRLLMEEAVTEHARGGAELLPWPPASMAQLLDAYDRAARDDLVVARLVGGDPAIFVKMGEELDHVHGLGLPFEIVPGIGSLGAAAAAIGRELIMAGTSEELIIASAKSPLPELARDEVVVAVYMAGDNAGELQEALTAGGRAPGTPCVIAHRLSWPDETVVICRLDELSGRLEDERFRRQTLVLVGVRPRADDR